MTRFIASRMLLALPALWLILTMVFLLAHIVPGDPVQQMLGEVARAEDLQQLRHALGLDQPLLVQYGKYLSGVARGSLGESFRFQQPVLRVVASHYPATLELAVIALLVCAAIGIPAGMLAAQRRGRAADHAIGVFTLFGLSVPNFALGPVLILIFSVILGWLPVSGRGGIAHLILPAITLGAALAAILTRMVRTSVMEELSSDYVHRPRQRTFRLGGFVSARVSQCAHSDSHDSRLAVRDAPRRHNRDGIDFFLARSRPPGRAGDSSSRLSALAGLHSLNRRVVRGRESAHRFDLCPD